MYNIEMNICIYLSNSRTVCLQTYICVCLHTSPTNKPVDLSIYLTILSISILAFPPGSPAVWTGHIPGHPEGKSPRNDFKSGVISVI